MAAPLESKYSPQSSYNYGNSNPVTWNDPTGMGGNDPQKAYEEGEKRTQAEFKTKLAEIQNSGADGGFKKFAAGVGLGGVVDLRNQLFASKIHSYQTAPGAKGMYGSDPNVEGNGVMVPESIRQRLWTEANQEAIPTLKATWAAMQSSGETSGITFDRNLNRTVSSRGEAWDVLKDTSVEIGLNWGLHIGGGGLGKLQGPLLEKKVATVVTKEVITAKKITNFENYGAEFLDGELRMIEAPKQSWSKVGRWMSTSELEKMQSSGRVIESYSTKTDVSVAGYTDFMDRTSVGSVYVEFEVPTKSLLQGCQKNWRFMIGSNATEVNKARLLKQGGEMLPKFRNLTSVLHTK